MAPRSIRPPDREGRKAPFFGNAGLTGSRTGRTGGASRRSGGVEPVQLVHERGQGAGGQAGGAVAGVPVAVRTVGGGAEVPVRVLELEDDPAQGVPVGGGPAGHGAAATISSSRFSSSRSDRAATT